MNYANVFFFSFFLLQSVKRCLFLLCFLPKLLFRFLSWTLVQCFDSVCCSSWQPTDTLMKESLSLSSYVLLHTPTEISMHTHTEEHNSFTYRILCIKRAGHTVLGLAEAGIAWFREQVSCYRSKSVSWKRKLQTLVQQQEGISHPEEERLGSPCV